MQVLEDNTVEITPKQLLYVTEKLVKEYHRIGRRSSSIPTQKDIWVMAEALNFTLWLCPAIGHEAVRLLKEKYPRRK